MEFFHNFRILSYSVFHNLSIKAGTKEVFDTITLPEHLNNYWSLKSSGKAVLNSEYNLNFTDTYNWFCNVSSVIPNESFYLKMIKFDAYWNSTIFGFNLEEKEEGTLVKFSHTNWLR